MQTASYEIITLDLTVAKDREVLVRLGNSIRAVYLNKLSAAAVLKLHIGHSGQALSMTEGRPVRFRSSAFTGQIAVTSPAAAGVIAEMLVVYDDQFGGDEAFEVKQ